MTIPRLASFLLLAISISGEILQLRDGPIKGMVRESKNGRKFRSYQGIPYAEPPIGELRFRAPEPVKPWSETKNTFAPPSICVQAQSMTAGSSGPFIGQEDCLYLNVFTPIDSNVSTKAPVIVFLHGGGYQYGNGAYYSPDYFMDEDVVFVTINFRLGVLGFLSMNNDHISGNFGMKDQSMALKWIHDNIAVFGGNPDDVTLMGESAGASSVHLHMFSPLSKGLFHKAIMQSGNAYASWAYDEDVYAEAVATSLIVSVGCFHRDPFKVRKCLLRVPAEELTCSGISLWANTLYSTSLLFKPTIESKVTHGAFLSQTPTKDNYLTNVPWLTGINSAEGAFIMQKYFEHHGRLFQLVNNDRYFILSKSLDYQLIADVEHWDDITRRLSDFYFGDNELGPNIAPKFVQMYTDGGFLYPLMKTLHSSRNTQYVYFYDYKSSFTSKHLMPNVTMDLGVCHADELPFLFRNRRLDLKWTPRDKEISKILLKNWINFVIYGDPNGPSSEKLWEPVKTGDIEYLHIKNDSIAMASKLLQERYKLWESLPLRRNRS